MARPLRIDYLVRAFCTLETSFFRIILLFNSRPTGRSWGKFYEIQAPIPALRHNALVGFLVALGLAVWLIGL